MFYTEGLMHRKINIWLALLVIFVIAGVFAWIISARGFLPVASSPGIGLTVFSPPLPCVLNPTSGTCPNCLVCGDLGGPNCQNLTEIQVQYLSGKNTLYKGIALCVPNPNFLMISSTGVLFKPGGQCLGNVTATPFGHILYNFSCSVPSGFF